MTLREKAELAEKAARASGEMLERHMHFKVMRKSENDFVTEMDFESEKLIRKILLDACPEDEFFGEESGGASRAKGRWIVDPIDGTVNYIHGLPCYTISIAYEQNGQLVIGCVFCPGTDELFLAVRGEGATRNGRPIHVADTSVLRNAVVNIGFGHRDPRTMERTLRIFPKLLPRVSDVRRYASAAYELSCVAAGASDAFMELGIHLYDFAAGYVILLEAGGRLTGWDPGEDAIQTGSVLGTNGILHEELQGILRQRD